MFFYGKNEYDIFFISTDNMTGYKSCHIQVIIKQNVNTELYPETFFEIYQPCTFFKALNILPTRSLVYILTKIM